jgi:uncharacterized protein involved in exopolysaccharide biosynthesis
MSESLARNRYRRDAVNAADMFGGMDGHARSIRGHDAYSGPSTSQERDAGPLDIASSPLEEETHWPDVDAPFVMTDGVSFSSALEPILPDPGGGGHPEQLYAAASPVLAAGRHWRFGTGAILFLVVATVAGAAIPALLAGPARFASQATVRFLPEASVRRTLVDIAAKRAVAPAFLADIVAGLQLDRNPEFTGDKAGAFGIAMDILAGNGNASDAPSRAQATLRDDIMLDADAAGGILRVSVTTDDPVRSGEIANRIARALAHDPTLGQAAAGHDQETDGSREAYDRAKATLAAFVAQAGDAKIAAALDLQTHRRQLDIDIKQADEAVVTARTQAAAAKSLTVPELLKGNVPRELSSSGLDDLRGRYQAAKAALTQLAAELGPRHPRLLAQQASVDDLAAALRTQLQRLAARSDAGLKTALDSRSRLDAQMTALAGRQGDVDTGRLDTLKSDVASARDRYEADLQKVGSAPALAGAPAVAGPAVAVGMPLNDGLAADQGIGFLAGLGAALSLLFLRKWRSGGSAEVPAFAMMGQGPAASDRDEPVLQPSSLPYPGLPDGDPVAAVGEDRPGAGEDIAQIRRQLADLNAKVAAYASQRRTARV